MGIKNDKPFVILVGAELFEKLNYMGTALDEKFSMTEGGPKDDFKHMAHQKEERSWRRESQDLIKNKDGHYNPNRVHANNHSSKINNRERSKKKRQKAKPNKRRH